MKNVLLSKLKFFTLTRLTFIFLFFITFWQIQKRQERITNFDCEICSDKAGYYMYLPAVFQMGFNADAYPEGYDLKRGYGFYMKDNKIVTKFTSGMAILLSPFYAAGAVIAKVFSIKAHPYSYYYLFFINIGAAFYIVLGLYFLYRFLNYYFKKRSSFLTVMLMFFGSSLYYYAIDETLMSHMYSFSLFSILLFGIKTYYETKKFKYFLLFVIAFSFAVLIRPTNILFGVLMLFLDVNSIESLKKNFQSIFRIKNIIVGGLILLAIFIPQFIYWKFAFGHYLPYTYGEEGFTNWNKPQIIYNWFSPQSGFFTYTPIALLSIFFAVVMLVKKQKNALLVIVAFAISSYMCASWHLVNFGGCNFGKRPMVEFLPLILFPIAYMLDSMGSFKRITNVLIVIILLFCVSYTLILFRGFNTCFFGDSWEWSEFGRLLSEAYRFVN